MKRWLRLSIILCLVSLISLISLITPKPLFAFTTVRFLYDGDGVRVAKIEGGKVILYGSNFEKDLSTGITTKYYASGKKQVAVKTNDSFSYLINDHHGSVTLTTTQNGSINSSSSYYPFGEYRTLSRIGSSRSYISQIKDIETDLYFLNTRYYNQKNGVFTSPDKVYDPQVNNRYAYTAGNPINQSDPSGQCVGPLVFLLPACIGIAEALVAYAPALIGVGTGLIVGGILEQEINSQVNEPGSSDYQTGVIVGQIAEISGGVMLGAGLTFLERGTISSSTTSRTSPPKATNWSVARVTPDKNTLKTLEQLYKMDDNFPVNYETNILPRLKSGDIQIYTVNDPKTGKFVGYATVLPTGESSSVYLNKVFTDPRYRQQGVSTAVVKRLQGDFNSVRLTDVTRYSMGEEASAAIQGNYINLGFQIEHVGEDGTVGFLWMNQAP